MVRIPNMNEPNLDLGWRSSVASQRLPGMRVPAGSNVPVGNQVVLLVVQDYEPGGGGELLKLAARFSILAMQVEYGRYVNRPQGILRDGHPTILGIRPAICKRYQRLLPAAAWQAAVD